MPAGDLSHAASELASCRVARATPASTPEPPPASGSAAAAGTLFQGAPEEEGTEGGGTAMEGATAEGAVAEGAAAGKKAEGAMAGGSAGGGRGMPTRFSKSMSIADLILKSRGESVRKAGSRLT